MIQKKAKSLKSTPTKKERRWGDLKFYQKKNNLFKCVAQKG